jgi:hypothetical protein
MTSKNACRTNFLARHKCLLRNTYPRANQLALASSIDMPFPVGIKWNLDQQ